MQMQAAQYINIVVHGVPPHMQTPKPLSGFAQCLKEKQGQFRGNLSEKRVEYTGLTIVSPDINLRIIEICPYNVDGDEMNTHVPQTEEARTELLC
ncbi:hypothetical protein CQW23_12184 [Capsicum baccatum]|uniref:Uncharacterized protein n=1 Tax=Capsicum baccatum TaxID=33114 RepID=A0A2G2WRU7_CAPBA|nr:hypothetical protein CQW23_12184 [Capsicum baccatum]